MIIQDSPTTIRLIGYEDQIDKLKKSLTFRKSSAVFEYQRFRNSRWAAQQMTKEAYYARLEELKAAQVDNLLFQDENGYWTYSGLAEYISEKFKDNEFENRVNYDLKKCIPGWTGEPPYPLRDYQRAAIDRLKEIRHGGIELATGGGKSLILMYLVKELGLKTLIVAPTKSIAHQLFDSFTKAFGKSYVGMVGDGKKQFKKKITIGIASSLTRLEEGDEGYELLADTQLVAFDEAHLVPASTFESIAHGVAKNAPYRFFVSGTQMRNDGTDLLLKAITGPIVYRMDVREGVDAGWLAKPVFRMFRINVFDDYYSKDTQRMIRRGFTRHPKVLKRAAELANMAVKHLGHQVVILIDEVNQFSHLYPLFDYEVGFAHGGVTAKQQSAIPKEFHKSDPKQLVADFNAGKFPILVGTSCINTGTDILTVQTIISIQGGKSEIKFRQSVGRGTRKTNLLPEKDSCFFIDFAVRNTATSEESDIVFRHALERIQIYNDIYGPVEYMEI